MTTTYHSLAKSDLTLAENLKLALKEGYKYLYMWVNSDTNWYFLAKTEPQARKGAIELYLQEKSSKGYTKADAIRFYSEFIDIVEIKEYLKDI